MSRITVRVDMPVQHSVAVKIGECTVQRGETLTVWLNQEKRHKRDAVQLELRVTKDGVPEVFIAAYAPEDMVRSLTDWTPLA